MKPPRVHRVDSRTLPVRVLFLIVWPVLIVTLLASVLVWRATLSEVRQGLTADLRLRTESLVQEIEFLLTLEPDNRVQLDRILERFIAGIRSDRRLLACVIVLDRLEDSEPIVWQTDNPEKCSGTGLKPAPIRVKRTLHYIGQTEDSSLASRLDISGSDNPPATLAITASPILTESGFYRTLFTGLGLVITVTGLAVAVGWRYGRSLVSGLQELSTTVANIARGERTIAPTLPGIPELDRIAEALASMAKDLGRADDRLRIALDQERERARQAMSQLQHANRQIRETAEARARFLARVSHELRTPLHVLLVLAEELQDHGGDEDRENRQRLLDCAEDLRRMVDDLLELHRIGQDDYAPDLQPVDLASLVRQQVTLAASPASRHDIRNHIGPSLPARLLTDERAVGIILRNLLSNACRYGGPPIEVTVDYATDPPWPTVILTVADRGPGLPPASVERVFEPFVQTHPGNAVGTGLGLALIRNYVAALGGSASAENRPDGGVWFSVRWPACPAPDQIDPAEQPSDRKHESPHAMVALVDDSPLVRHAAIIQIRRCGYQGVAFESVDALLEARSALMDTGRLKAVLCDLTMPDTTPAEAIGRLVNAFEVCRVPVLAFTAAVDEAAFAAARDAGAAQILTKPLNVGELAQAIDQANE